METYCFKIINDLQEVRELFHKFSLKKNLKIDSERVYIKNNFIFFKANFEELDTNLKKIKFFNTYIFQYPEPLGFYKTNKFFLIKNLFLDLPNIAFVFDGGFIKLLVFI